MLQTRVDSGLDGVIVADTVMSEVDGEAGRLIVRGHAIEELVAHARLRGRRGPAVGRLRRGRWRRGAPSAQGLRRPACGPLPKCRSCCSATKGLKPVEGLRVGLGMLADSEPMPHHYLVCGALPVFLAALLRASEGKSALAPDPVADDGAGPAAHDPRPARRRGLREGRSTPISPPSPITASTPRPSPRASSPRRMPASSPRCWRRSAP